MAAPAEPRRLEPALASDFAGIALGHVTREYPHLLDHVLTGDEDVLPPRLLHPIFFGSFDWHSCVHGWWTLLTLRRLFPAMPEGGAITALADTTFTADKVAGELNYLARPHTATFERPYGWAWLLMLHLEATRHRDRPWGEALAPLAAAFAERLSGYLTLLTYPVRSGTHANSAFAVTLSLQWAERFAPSLAEALRRRAKEWFAADPPYAGSEPGGEDFLSPALVGGLCLSRCLPAVERSAWLARFLPRLVQGEPATLLVPATVSTRGDGKIAHLDGLNLSRAWCWRGLAADMAGPAREVALVAAERHLDAALPHLADAYGGEHWLASFALLALLEPG
ncbi:MAG: DUF2891 domain-containing protein [Novosphingobium sp.]